MATLIDKMIIKKRKTARKLIYPTTQQDNILLLFLHPITEYQLRGRNDKE